MSKFTAAVARAKKLYKTGRYKRFSDAVKVAFKKKVGSTYGADSSKGAGHTSTSTKATTTGNRTATKTITAHMKVGRIKRRKQTRRRSAPRPKKSLGTKYKQVIKKQLANALLSYELATTVKATKAAQKRKVALRKKLKAL